MGHWINSHVLDFPKNHPLCTAILGFLVIVLPQWASALWSLFSSEPLAVVVQKGAKIMNLPTFSPYWVTTPIGLFLFALVLYYLKTKRKFTFDYAYSLGLQGIHLAYDDSVTPAPLQLGLVLANVAEGPIKYEVDQFEVVIEDRAIAHPVFKSRGGVILRSMSTIYFYPPFAQELPEGRDHLNGVIRFAIRYGHPEIGFLRTMKKEVSFSLRLGDKSGIVYLTEKESDDGIGK